MIARMDANAWAWIVAVLLIVVGLAGTILPALPGVTLVFAGLVVGAWADGFERVGGVTLGLLGLLTLVSLGIDFAATALGAKRVGATRYAVLGAALGTLAGVFLGIPGLLVGPFAGAVTGELLSHGEWRRATSAGLGTWVGLLCGTLAKIALAFAMLGVFLVAYFVG